MAWPTTSRQSRGYGQQWVRLRARILERDNHLCRPCLAAGRVTAANQVDHIKPKAQGGNDADDNLQAICKPCHDDKTTRDGGGTVRPPIGADGWPGA